MSFLIPITRLREILRPAQGGAPNLLAFHHPSPGYKFHVLILPKRQVDSPASLDPADTAFLTDLYAIVHSLVEDYQLISPSPQPLSPGRWARSKGTETL